MGASACTAGAGCAKLTRSARLQPCRSGAEKKGRCKNADEALSGSAEHELVKPAMTSAISVQSAGGPRLKGNPGEAVERTASTNTTAIVAILAVQLPDCSSDGKTSPAEPHRSQWPLDGDASSPAGCPPPLALHSPPNWPVRTSSASRDTGASSAANTATNPSHAARRTQSG